MRNLTNYQKEFILNNFFKNEEYAGWRGIGECLIESGGCIVPGTECIWVGGIGNFIKIENTKDAIDCIVYKFDLEYFMSSEWYKSIREQYMTILSDKLSQIQNEYNELDMI